MDIEAVAEEDPNAIHTETISLKDGLTDAKAELICKNLALEGKTFTQGVEQLKRIYKMFLEVDAT